MNDKYYTPEIEEFHMGFEFEVNDTDEGWTKEIFCSGEGRKIDSISKLTEFSWSTLGIIKFEDAYRVKYLDKEDVESLGFTTNKLKYWEIQDDSIIYKLKNYTLVFWHSAYKSKYKTNVYIRQETGLGQHCFKGEIKNKSELKRLLKQLQL